MTRTEIAMLHDQEVPMSRSQYARTKALRRRRELLALGAASGPYTRADSSTPTSQIQDDNRRAELAAYEYARLLATGKR